MVTRREGDGRFALVTVEVALEVELDPVPGPEALHDLVAKAERDWWTSLTASPNYAWTVNGSRVDQAAASPRSSAGSSSREEMSSF